MADTATLPEPAVEATTKLVAKSAGALVARRLVLTVASVVSTAVLARKLSVSNFGAYSAGLSSFYLLQAACDLGFSTVLAREMAVRPHDRFSLLKSLTIVATAWSVVVGIALGAMAVLAGTGTPRGTTMLVLAPAIAFNGLGMTRQVFMVDYRVGVLARVDVVTNLAQSLGLAGLALVGVRPWVLGLWVSSMVIANLVWLALTARRSTARGPIVAGIYRQVLMMSLPIGLTSLLASAYFMLDITIDGYLVSSSRLAPYAAAVKVVTILLSLPAILMSAAMPAMARLNADSTGMGELVARMWHWMAVTMLPLTVGIAVFAPTLVRVLFGPDYSAAVPLLRILLISVVVALLSNVVGNVLVARRRAWVMLIQNSAAVVLNVVGNILLVPRVGVVASAWLTLGTEVLVCGCSVLWLGRSMSFGPMLRASFRPTLALVPLALAGLLPWPELSIPAAAAGFVIAVSCSHAWPAEFPLIGRLSRSAV